MLPQSQNKKRGQSMLRNLIDIIASPSEAFSSILQKPSILFPLLLVAAAAASVQLAYFLNVDFDYLVDELTRQAVAVTGAPEDQLRANYRAANPSMLAIFSTLSTAAVIALVMVSYAGYLTLVSKFGSQEVGYRRWLSLTAWTSVPALLGALASWVVILSSSDGRIGLQEANVLSLNNLLFRTDGAFANMLNALSLPQLWSLALLALAYRQWTGKSPGAAFALALLPYLLIYALWAAAILL